MKDASEECKRIVIIHWKTNAITIKGYEYD